MNRIAGEPGFLATVPAQCKALSRVDASVAASGPHDFAVRAGIARPAMPARPPHSHPTFRDGREASLLFGRERGEVVKVIFPSAQEEFLKPGALVNGKAGHLGRHDR